MKKAEIQEVLSLIQNLSDYIADAPLNTTTRFHAGWQGRVQHVVRGIQGMVDEERKEAKAKP